MDNITYTVGKDVPQFKPFVEKGCKLFKTNDKGHLHLDVPHNALGIKLLGVLDFLVQTEKVTWAWDSRLRVKRPLPKVAKVATIKRKRQLANKRVLVS